MEQVPVLHVRGTHYVVGNSIGRTFAGLIHSYLESLKFFGDVLLPLYSTEEGREIYENSLGLCQRKFPQYVQEMQGIADGAGIPFHHLFLLHIESYLVPPKREVDTTPKTEPEPEPETDVKLEGGALLGCTGVICNQVDIVLGHTEDAPIEMTNHFFIVSAEIVSETGETLEKFSTLTYPGYLPGYTMGFNHHGIVYSGNTIVPATVYPHRTPVQFITRAVLGARDEEDLVRILKDAGTGIGDGFSLNLIFVKEGGAAPSACNIEISPHQSGGDESEIDVHWVAPGSSYYHCNVLRRQETEMAKYSYRSSSRRHAAIERLGLPSSLRDVKNILSDRSDPNFPIFRTSPPEERAATVAVGLFDIKKRTWSIYTQPPKNSQPVVQLHLDFAN